MAGYMKDSKSCEWETPRELYDRLNNIFNFEVDLACTSKNKKCELGLYSFNSYSNLFIKNHNYFCNPPYGDILKWVSYCKDIYHRNKKNNTVVMLIPASTDIKAWEDIIWIYAKYVVFLYGRIKFEMNGKPVGSCPKGSALIVFTDKDYALEKELYYIGKTINNHIIKENERRILRSRKD